MSIIFIFGFTLQNSVRYWLRPLPHVLPVMSKILEGISVGSKSSFFFFQQEAVNRCLNILHSASRVVFWYLLGCFGWGGYSCEV